MLTSTEQEKRRALARRFEDNFLLTRYYSLFLSEYPETLNTDMLTPLIGSGLAPEEAYAACLSVLFGLDTEKSAEDRRFYREYLIPSVRHCDPGRYRSDPYFRAVPLENTKAGKWEIRIETYPAYRAFVCGDVECDRALKEITPIGFFEEPFSFPAILEDGNEWMTLTPVDLDTCRDAIEEAIGKVVTFGLGLGYFAFRACEKEEVTSVTVVELSEEVIELFIDKILPYFPHPEKLRIVHSDAFEYAEKTMPEEKFDFAFVDTWRDASDGYGTYLRMKKLEKFSPTTRFSYWVEKTLLSRLRAMVWNEVRLDWEDGRESEFFASCDALYDGMSDGALASLAKRVEERDGCLCLIKE